MQLSLVLGASLRRKMNISAIDFISFESWCFIILSSNLSIFMVAYVYQRINRRTEELQSGAENFASLADELVKAMEKRKWWQV